MKRKLKKYDVINLVTMPDRANNIGECFMGDYLVLYIKPEGIGLFCLRSRMRHEMSLKDFKQKYRFTWSNG